MMRSAVVFIVPVFLAGCSINTPGEGLPVPARTTTTTTTENDKPQIPRVTNPRQVDRYLDRPCQALSEAGLAQFDLGRIDGHESIKDNTGHCIYAGDKAEDRRVRVFIADAAMLGGSYSYDGDKEGFSPIEIGGHPATSYQHWRGCVIVVAVADDQGFRLEYEPGDDGPKGDIVCERAMAGAEAILAKLPPA